MKTLQAFYFALTLTAGSISLAYADCYKDGKAYPTNTVINGFICTADGNWVKL